jgi:hypothetical protein
MNNIYRLLLLTGLIFSFAPTSRALVINITYDATVTNLMNPAQVQPAVASVVQWFQNQYTNPITINITVAFSSGVSLGQSQFSLLGKTYSQVTNAFNSRRVSAADFSSVASLPASDPTGAGSTWYVPRAECKVLGLTGVTANDTTTDGTVTFSSTKSYTFDPTNRAVAGKFDFIGVVQHEISEVMGRAYLLRYGIGGYSPCDMFRFTNNAARSFGTNDANVYFSVDNGATVQKTYYGTVTSGDLQDWASSTPQDAYDAFVSSGKQSVISSADILALDVLGYNMPVNPPTRLTGTRLTNGSFQLNFNTIANASFTVLATTNLALPLASWNVLGAPTEFSTGAYQYTDTATGNQRRFYRVRSP